MLGGKIKRPHYEASKFKGFEFVRTLNRSTGSRGSRGRAAMNIEQENQSAREGQVFIDSGDHRVATFLELTGTKLACEERK